MRENDWGTPTQEYVDVQNSFNQTFVSTVRATGGNNANRYLVVQAFNTNIDNAANFAVIPNDTVAGRLFMEVHYYDPYNFTLNISSSITEWPSTEETWANEVWLDGVMNLKDCARLCYWVKPLCRLQNQGYLLQLLKLKRLLRHLNRILLVMLTGMVL